MTIRFAGARCAMVQHVENGIVAVLITGIALAQVNTGTLSGSITDPSGGAIASASVRIRNVQTGVSATWISNESGFYKAPFLQPGSYSIRVEAVGFRAWEMDASEILVGKETVEDISLVIGDVAESVTVRGTPALIESSTAQAGVNFSAHKILHLPRVSVGLDRLALLAPGVTPTFGNVSGNGAIFSANGQRPRSNGFLLDGQDNSHRMPTGPRAVFNIPEAVSEYQIITNQFSAEYAMAQGSIANITTRSGTNQFHGTGNWLHRNDAHMAALTNFQKRAGDSTPPKFIENRYGATVGGPVRKDKAFFFVYFDNQTLRSDRRAEAGLGQLTPTSLGLRALQQEFPNSNTVAALLQHGPLTRPQGNPSFLAGSLRSDTVRTASGNPVTVEMGRILRQLKNPQDFIRAGGRIDLDVNPYNRISSRYYHRQWHQHNAGGNDLSGYTVHGNFPARSAAVSWTRVISPTFVNELRFGYDYDLNEFVDPSGAPYQELGRNISEFFPPAGYLGFGLPANQPSSTPGESFQVMDNISHYRGRHALKYGVQWSRFRANAGVRPFYNGQFVFDTFQNFVDNRPQVNGVDGPLYTPHLFIDSAGYLQDDIRLRENLTLNLGVRYEVPSSIANFASDISVPRERDPATAIWDPNLPLDARTNVSVGRDLNNWSPRVGFAWSPRRASWLTGNQSTVIRGGYSINYDVPYGLLGTQVLQAAPLVLRYSVAAAVPTDVTGEAVRKIMQPARGLDPRRLVNAQFSADLHSSMLHSWSLGFQRKVGNRQTYELRYAGNRGIGLFQSRNANPKVQSYIDAGFPEVIPPGVRPGINPDCPSCGGRVDPAYGVSIVLANTASSTYHALQTRYEGRVFSQLALGGAYTWSRSIDNASDNDPRSGPLAQNPFDITRGERGPSAFDAPHVLALNFVWDVPIVRFGPGIVGQIVNGWSLAGVVRSFTGPPATPQQRATNEPGSANDTEFGSAFGLNSDMRRPFSGNPLAPLNTVGLVRPDGSMVDLRTTALVTPAQVRWIYNNTSAAHLIGTPFGAGRNVVRGPAIHQTDLSLFKTMRLTERINLQLRMEADNAFNHPNLRLGITFVEVSGFFNPTETEAGARRLAVGIRLVF